MTGTVSLELEESSPGPITDAQLVEDALRTAAGALGSLPVKGVGEVMSRRWVAGRMLELADDIAGQRAALYEPKPKRRAR